MIERGDSGYDHLVWLRSELRKARDDALESAAHVVALTEALKGLAMRHFRSDGTYCWCDGPVTDPETWIHDDECTAARAAMTLHCLFA